MTEVAFHFNMPDKLAYACRLLRKAHAAGKPVGVLAPPDALAALDQALWQFSARDFIPHCQAGAPAHVLQASPIVLAERCEQLPAPHEVLLNLGASVPEGFERYARLIELVDTSEQDRSHARQRWRHYAERGYPIQRHDWAAKEQPA